MSLLKRLVYSAEDCKGDAVTKKTQALRIIAPIFNILAGVGVVLTFKASRLIKYTHR